MKKIFTLILGSVISVSILAQTNTACQFQISRYPGIACQIGNYPPPVVVYQQNLPPPAWTQAPVYGGPPVVVYETGPQVVFVQPPVYYGNVYGGYGYNLPYQPNPYMPGYNPRPYQFGPGGNQHWDQHRGHR